MLWLVVFLAVVAIVAAASLQPDLSLPEARPLAGFQDLVLHVCAYATICLLAGLAFGRLVFAGLISFAISAGLEYLQLLFPPREVHISDLLANLLGVLCGLFVLVCARMILHSMARRQAAAAPRTRRVGTE